MEEYLVFVSEYRRLLKIGGVLQSSGPKIEDGGVLRSSPPKNEEGGNYSKKGVSSKKRKLSFDEEKVLRRKNVSSNK